jgi:hypothetical protein
MSTPEPQPHFGPPAGGGRPPAPPATGEPGGRPDPSDPGPPIPVSLGGVPLGDLGNPRVDSRLLMALLLRRGEVAQWLEARSAGRAAVSAAFPGCGWPLDPPLSWMDQPPEPSNPAAVIDVDLHTRHLGILGDAGADARLLCAIALRPSQVSRWLSSLGVDAADVTRPSAARAGPS